jgi:hypothetical protein
MNKMKTKKSSVSSWIATIAGLLACAGVAAFHIAGALDQTAKAAGVG